MPPSPASARVYGAARASCMPTATASDWWCRVSRGSSRSAPARPGARSSPGTPPWSSSGSNSNRRSSPRGCRPARAGAWSRRVPERMRSSARCGRRTFSAPRDPPPRPRPSVQSRARLQAHTSLETAGLCRGCSKLLCFVLSGGRNAGCRDSAMGACGGGNLTEDVMKRNEATGKVDDKQAADNAADDDTPDSMARRKVLVGGATAALTLGSPRIFAAGPAKEIRLGYISPRSGPLGAFNECDSYMLPLVRKALAKGLSIGGETYRVTILDRDSQSSPSRASQLASELINQHDIHLMLSRSE